MWAGGSTVAAAIATGSQIAHNAVENNWLLPREIEAAKAAITACEKTADAAKCKHQTTRAINDLDTQRDRQLSALNSQLENDYLARATAYTAECGQNLRCVTEGYALAKSDNDRMRLKALRELFPAGTVTDIPSLKKQQEQLIAGKGFYPKGELLALKDEAQNRATELWNKSRQYWNRKTLGEMASDALQSGKSGLKNTWEGIKGAVPNAIEWLKQPLPAQNLEEKLDQIVFSNRYQQGQMASDEAAGGLVMTVGGKVTEKLVNGVWEKVAKQIDKTQQVRTMGEILAPKGNPVEQVRRGAGPRIRTVSAAEFNQLESQLMEGASAINTPKNYSGTWYQRNDGSIFGVRNSVKHGKTIDIVEGANSGLDSGFKVHQE